MDKRMNIHVGAMFLLSLGVSYLVVEASTTGGSEAYNIGVVFGRAFGSVLFPFILASIPACIYKLIKKKTMPGYLIMFWVLWSLVVVLSTFGSLVTSQG